MWYLDPGVLPSKCGANSWDDPCVNGIMLTPYSSTIADSYGALPFGTPPYESFTCHPSPTCHVAIPRQKSFLLANDADDADDAGDVAHDGEGNLEIKENAWK